MWGGGGEYLVALVWGGAIISEELGFLASPLSLLILIIIIIIIYLFIYLFITQHLFGPTNKQTD